jgi:hypothetical protein
MYGSEVWATSAKDGRRMGVMEINSAGRSTKILGVRYAVLRYLSMPNALRGTAVLFQLSLVRSAVLR